MNHPLAGDNQNKASVKNLRISERKVCSSRARQRDRLVRQQSFSFRSENSIGNFERLCVVRALITYRAVAALALSPSSSLHSGRKKGVLESIARL
jgi:hypothetical protein